MKITNRFATEDYVTMAAGEKITSPFTGLVGQTIVVKEIDESEYNDKKLRTKGTS